MNLNYCAGGGSKVQREPTTFERGCDALVVITSRADSRILQACFLRPKVFANRRQNLDVKTPVGCWRLCPDLWSPTAPKAMELHLLNVFWSFVCCQDETAAKVSSILERLFFFYLQTVFGGASFASLFCLLAPMKFMSSMGKKNVERPRVW